MRRLISILLLAWMGTLSYTAYSQEQDSTLVQARPKVGLVLSGGGAKGAAHIGVIKYLEEVGIPIDYIAGTSMGAIVGGMYALGYSSDELLEIISNVDWNQLISNQVDRQQISYQRKQENSTEILSFPFSVKTGQEELQTQSFKNSLPTGIVSGDNLINLFNSLSVGYSDSTDFSNMPTPFLCIATNLLNGEGEVMDHGSFSKAIRASMAIPVLFDPVSIDQSLYADGGLINNFPAEQCRAMGADFVIGVSMSQGLENDPKKITSIFTQVTQIMRIITDKEYDNYHQLCDIFISPELKGVGMLSFDAESIAKVTQSGYEAAAKQEDTFLALREKLFAGAETIQKEDNRNPQKARNILEEKVLISGVEMAGINDRLLESWIERKCTIQAGDSVSKKDIDKSVSIYYGTGNYASITYSLHEDPAQEGAYRLKLKFIENPANHFGLGFHFDSQDWLSLLLHVGANSKRMNGFKADLQTKLGGNQWLNANLSFGHRLYPRINLAYQFRNSELDAYDMDQLVMNKKFLQHKVRLYLSENYSRTVHFGAGVEAQFLNPRKVMYPHYDTADEDYQPVNTLGTFAFLHVDNLNKNSFATRGVKGKVDFSWKDMQYSSQGTRKMGLGSLILAFESYIPIVEDRLVLVPQLYGSLLFGEGATSGEKESWNPLFKGPVPTYPTMNNVIGGAEMGRYIDQQLPFIGVNKISLAFNNIAIARLDLRTRLFENHYLTAIINFARSSVDLENFFAETDPLRWPEFYQYNASNWWGAGLRYSIDTKIGALSFDISSSNISRRPNLYFSLGHYF